MPRSNWTIFRCALRVAVLVALSGPTKPLLADTTLNSGTTTVSTGTNFGGDLYVATTGTATLNVIAGGYASSTNGYLGQNASGVGTANVSSGTWANSGNLYVGNFGTGTLNVNGGNVTNAIGYLSYNNGNVGTATVSSGTWANSGGLVVGDSGRGTLNVTGGYVSNEAGTLGNSSDGVGTANVSSGTWANRGNLTVGYLGIGTLNVNGGSVTNIAGSLGFNAGRVGTATVSSGTWANSGNLAVGSSGTGTLTINGGLVSVAGTLTKGTYGTIDLNAGGTLQIGVGIGGGVLLGGTGSLVNNGTLVFNRSNASTHSGTISGTGAVTKQGAGTLTLSGNNSYTGGTTIGDGVLALGSANAVGTSGTISFGGGTLQYSASNTIDYSSRFSTAASQASEIDTNGQNVTLASPLTSSGGTLTKFGTGTLTLSGNNSYTGGTTISGGRITLGNANGLGAAGAVTITSGTLDLNGRSVTLGALTGSSGGTITTGVAGSATLTSTAATSSNYAGAITNGSGTTAFTKQGSGTLTLSGNNSYTGGTTISDGVLALGSANAVGTSGTIAFGGGTLQYSASNTTDYSSRFSTAASQAYEIDTNGQNVTLASPLTSSGGTLTKFGTGTLTLSGNNSYTGGTTIRDGVVAVTAGGGISHSSASMTIGQSSGDSGTLNVTGGSVTNTTGTLGNLAGGVGTATVSSGTWANGGALTIGNSGTGTLNVTGGYVSNTAGTLGSAAGSNGTATVSSGTWANNGGDLVVGVSGTGTLTINGGLVSVAGTLSKGTYGTINLNAGGTLQIGVGGMTGVLGVSTLTNNGTLIFNRSNASTYSGIIGGPGTIQNAGAGTTTLTGQTSYTVPLIATAGRLIVGSTASVNGFSTTGSLAVASGATLELRSKGLAYVNGLSTLTGGTIRAANGISLGAGANVVGTGAVSGRVAAGVGSRVEASGGRLTLGDAASYSGIYSDGELYVNANEVELLDRNLAVLGSLTQLGDGSAGGTLRAANGMLLEQGKNLVGRGTVYGNFINQGHVYGDGSSAGQEIVFAAGSTVSGIGSFENVVFDGTYSPGNSPAITSLSNGEFSAASSLIIELGGTQPGTQYDRVVDSGVLALLGGTLDVVLYNGFVPSYGNSFEILQYGQLSGDFGTVNYPALSGGLSWERTTSATAMTITVVPEPSTYAISAIATAGLASLMRLLKQRTRESEA
jgi:fibronectin-binding autotransporter adhesin